MFKKSSLLAISIMTILAIAITACAPAATPEPTPAPTQEPTMEPTEEMQSIVDIAVADGRFETLVAALQAAGLAEALAGKGSFMVFAPTDDAFAKLPEGTVEALLEDLPALTDILLYHVVDGKVMAEDVVTLESAQTLQGEAVSISVENGMVYINDAQVIITDIMASNGVIHVIDTVLLPPAEEPMSNIVEIAVADGRFTTLVAALQAAGLDETLAGEGSFTVFAPTDDAFAKLPEGTVEALLQDIPALTDILLYHVVDGKVMAADVVALEEALTLLGEPVSIRVEGDMVYINDAQVLITDIVADNGVIHVIDSVLLPPES
ncbi:fasciclin domain-containing protein [Chloroflexota bacterium]|nr:fasciclin domain-containing protein [Chloroflexota bacterium]